MTPSAVIINTHPCTCARWDHSSSSHRDVDHFIGPCRSQEDSDFFSSRGSFGSLDEEYVRDSLKALGSKLPPGPLPPFGSAEAAQWFDEWNASIESHMLGRLGGAQGAGGGSTVSSAGTSA